MKLEDRFFPRVWDGERYWYPCFSELGITYEAEDLPFIEENIKSLDWALGWHFPQNGDDLEFNHIVEACTGLKDKNGKLIYEGDIVETEWFDEKTFYQVGWDKKMACFVFENEALFCVFDDLPTDVTEIVGNIHENSDMLKNPKNFNTSAENVKGYNK